ncbi:hypothetical protein V2A60_003499 [Cordyceps javanica]|uniref:BZIP domain-containing protein n=1 Tax=Cordyceps javanica TaxID=43265 RepID=A0A545V2X8_9HYPO|nr:hypothetical protein IF1G_04636 [Cordyceps javanica]TQW07347.1 hypothetical protein IF2G_04508 [Cordyceps javanica]
MSEPRHQSGQPRTRQRAYKAPPQLDVPEIEDDAAERKRVLNVLAQRRYREKKRQRRLNQQSRNEPEDEDAHNSQQEIIENEPQVHMSCVPDAPEDSGLDGIEIGWPASIDIPMAPLLLNSNQDLNLAQADGEWCSFPTNFNSANGGVTSLEFLPSSSNASSPPSFGTSPSSVDSDGSLSDSYLLPVYELTLLKGLLRIAERLGSPEDVWSLTSQSPFTRGGGTPAHQLPPTWQPTATQILMPHHPFLDFLPWPSVRDKVIQIFSLPEGSRPPSAAGPMGLANLAYDIEDNSEGVRIYGDDPYDAACWEVGQVFFQRWWFLFDRDIITTSNRWRRLRGAPPLAIKAAGEEEAG